MEHSVRTTQAGVLYLTDLVDLAAAAAEAICQSENGFFQRGGTGGHPAYHSPSDEL
jgi:hypothetical protein